MQKTELNTQEAILAYGQGKRISDRVGDEYWLEDGKPKAKYKNSNATTTASPVWEFGPFTIVEPPHVNPTLEECLAAEEVRVTYPNRAQATYLAGYGGFITHVSYALDKGWKVEVVK